MTLNGERVKRPAAVLKVRENADIVRGPSGARNAAIYECEGHVNGQPLL